MGKAKYIIIDGLNERIKLLMDSNNLTYVGFAKSIGLNHATVWSWLNVGTMPRLDAIMKICEVYNVTADWILWGCI